MKIIKNISTILLAATTLIACSSDENMDVPKNQLPVKIQASIGSLIPVTRATGDTWENADAIGVYMKSAGMDLSSNIVNAAFNIKYTTPGNGLFTVSKVEESIYYPQNKAVDFIAYYPFRNVINQHIYKVNVADQTTPAHIDLLYSDNVVGVTSDDDPNLNMWFSHQLSKIVLDISAGTGINSLDGLRVDITGQNTEADFALSNAGLTPIGSGVSSIVLKQTPNGTKLMAEAIILPAAATPDRTLVFTLSDSRQYVWPIPSSTNFEKGKKYTYNVVLKMKGAEVIRPEATITDWDDIPSEVINTEELKTHYKLVWEDSFDGTALDMKSWNIEVVPNPANNEMQYYRAENISVGTEPISGENCLILTAKKEDFGGRSFTSGRLNSLQKVAFRYGRMDARVKTPKTANGLWPAYWMKGNDNNVVSWPMCGELDILEMGHVDGINSGTQDRYLGAACHWGTSSTTYKSFGLKNTIPYSLQDDGFHLYTLVWDENYVKLYLDLDKYPENEPYYTFHYSANKDNAINYFQKEYFILFNLAVGGGYTGITGAANIDKITGLNVSNGYEAKMYIDYVKIYQTGNVNEKLSLPK